MGLQTSYLVLTDRSSKFHLYSHEATSVGTDVINDIWSTMWGIEVAFGGGVMQYGRTALEMFISKNKNAKRHRDMWINGIIVPFT